MDITMGYDGARLIFTIRQAATTLTLRLNKEGAIGLGNRLLEYGNAMPSGDDSLSAWMNESNEPE